MKKWLAPAGVLGVLLATGCGGSGETKTITATVEAKAAREAPAPSDVAATEEATTARPTNTTIPDGTWAKGEYKPGSYRAPGGPGCEWEQREKLGEEAEGTGRWGIGESNILAEITSAYFVTEGCGLWQKVG